MAPAAPIPAAVAAGLWIAFAGKRFAPAEKRLRRLLLAACLFVLCGTRASSAIENFKAGYQKARDEIGAPQRCAGKGEVILSPTIRTREPEGGKPEEHITLWSAR